MICDSLKKILPDPCHSGLDPESILSLSKFESNVDTGFRRYDNKVGFYRKGKAF